MRVWLEEQEITGLCTAVTVDKNIDAAGAVGEIRVICIPEAAVLPAVDPACGQWITVKDGTETVFSGRTESVRFDAARRTLILRGYDPAGLLARCQVFGPYRGTPADIAAAVIRDCGLEPGTVWNGGGEQTFLAGMCGVSAFRALCGLYPEGCVTACEDGRIHVLPRGSERKTLNSAGIVSIVSRNSGEKLVNRVLLCADGKVTAGFTAEDSLREHGLRQVTVPFAAGFLSPAETAQECMHGVDREARVTLAGRSDIRCGQLVTADQPRRGVFGTYLVTESKLCCEGGRITTELGMVSL